MALPILIPQYKFLLHPPFTDHLRPTSHTPIDTMKQTLTALIALATLAHTARLQLSIRQQSAVLGSCSATQPCIDPDALLLVCRNGQCVPSKEGAPCQNSLQCSTFTFCGENATCRRGKSGAACANWRQCDLGFFCSANDNVCLPTKEGSECRQSYNCGDGLTCKGLKCVPGTVGENCRTNKDCSSGICSFSIVGQFATGLCTAPLKPSPSSSPKVVAPPKPVPAPAAPKPAPASPKEPATAAKPAAAADPAKPAEDPKPAPAPAPDAAPATNATEPQPATPPQPTPASGENTTDTTTATDTATAISTPGAESETTTSSTEVPNETLVPDINPSEGNTTEKEPICIGASSHVAGSTLQQLLHPSMRMQRHPLRMMKGNPPVRMLCYEGANALLCASARHVIHVNGKHMYMSQYCKTRVCEMRMEVPLNFKGPCGMHIEFLPGVRVTQHAGGNGLDAVAVARAECAARANNRLMWTVRTL